MQIYTEKIHATRLLKMLERKNPCGLCPAAPSFDPKLKRTDYVWEEEHCVICEQFVGYFKDDCPCNKYGHKEAIKRTWLSLEAKGYSE